MKTHKNLTIIGTSHISPESVKEVKDTINNKNPAIIALELDQNRLMALLSKNKKNSKKKSMVKELGIKGALFNIIGAWAEKKMGKMVGMEPGSEMKIALKLAGKKGIHVALIDRDIRITIKNLFKYIKFREKMNFVADIFKGIFGIDKELKRIDLRKVPDKELIDFIIKRVKKRYPGFYKALIEERNIFMAKRLYKLMEMYKDEEIIAVVGAGHENEIINIIEKEEKVNEN